jgi:hypothetical protein
MVNQANGNNGNAKGGAPGVCQCQPNWAQVDLRPRYRNPFGVVEIHLRFRVRCYRMPSERGLERIFQDRQVISNEFVAALSAQTSIDPGMNRCSHLYVREGPGGKTE